jgi:fructokinase
MGFNVIGIGEVLWDLLPTGPQLGGAPVNFAYHARALGAGARVITRLGSDQLGREIRQRFEAQEIADGTLQVDDDAPTGTVSIALSAEGVPSYTIHKNVAWDRLTVTSAAFEAVRGADAICFGSLAQRSETSRTSIRRLVAAASASSLRIFDPNLRQGYYSFEIIEHSLRLANVLKLNEAELSVIAALFRMVGSPPEQIEQLAHRFNLQLIALTRGPAGSLLFQNGKWSDCPSVPIQIADTVGAGDAFTATLVMGLLRKMELREINYLADEVARHVCSCAGATPPLPEMILRKFGRMNPTAKLDQELRSK